MHESSFSYPKILFFVSLTFVALRNQFLLTVILKYLTTLITHATDLRFLHKGLKRVITCDYKAVVRLPIRRSISCMEVRLNL